MSMLLLYLPLLLPPLPLEAALVLSAAALAASTSVGLEQADKRRLGAADENTEA